MFRRRHPGGDTEAISSDSISDHHWYEMRFESGLGAIFWVVGRTADAVVDARGEDDGALVALVGAVEPAVGACAGTWLVRS